MSNIPNLGAYGYHAKINPLNTRWLKIIIWSLAIILMLSISYLFLSRLLKYAQKED